MVAQYRENSKPDQTRFRANSRQSMIDVVAASARAGGARAEAARAVAAAADDGMGA